MGTMSDTEHKITEQEAYLVNVDFGQILVMANSISEVDKKIKEAGIFHYEIEKVIEYVL